MSLKVNVDQILGKKTKILKEPFFKGKGELDTDSLEKLCLDFQNYTKQLNLIIEKYKEIGNYNSTLPILPHWYTVVEEPIYDKKHSYSVLQLENICDQYSEHVHQLLIKNNREV